MPTPEEERQLLADAIAAKVAAKSQPVAPSPASTACPNCAKFADTAKWASAEHDKAVAERDELKQQLQAALTEPQNYLSFNDMVKHCEDDRCQGDTHKKQLQAFKQKVADERVAALTDKDIIALATKQGWWPPPDIPM
ncbi:MAG: hypothetical protein KJ587_19905 [Alphaproteobacteria bacterium]|nr:hypothetical protein [Alphaproteobacteria bacterium]